MERILYVSPAYEQIWGRERSTLLERPASFLDTVHPEDQAAMARTLTRCVFRTKSDIVSDDCEQRFGDCGHPGQPEGHGL